MNDKPKSKSGRPRKAKLSCKPGDIKVRKQIIKKKLLEGSTKKDALLAAGYPLSTATKKGTSICKPIMEDPDFIKTLRDRGMTDDKLADVAVEGLDATKVISAMVIMPSGEGMKEASGMTKDFIEVPDYDARHKFLVTGLKLKGHLKDKMDIDLTVETYEQRRKRLGLDDE